MKRVRSTISRVWRCREFGCLFALHLYFGIQKIPFASSQECDINIPTVRSAGTILTCLFCLWRTSYTNTANRTLCTHISLYGNSNDTNEGEQNQFRLHRTQHLAACLRFNLFKCNHFQWILSICWHSTTFLPILNSLFPSPFSSMHTLDQCFIPALWSVGRRPGM